jgi:hypothetical protein
LEAQREEILGVRDGLAALTTAIEQLHRGNHNNNDGESVNNSRGNNIGNNGGLQARVSRLDFPRFDGEDPTGWIYTADQFFQYQGTAAREKVLLASFHLKEEALQWYQWYERSHPDVYWEEFTQALCVRFGPSDFEDFDEALAKLRQTGTIREYQNQFERLAAKVQNWPEKALVGSYIGGLRDDIRAEVKLFKPTTLTHAISLARLQDDKL